MISFWEQQSFTRYDYIIVGGGIVGLSSAISLKEKEKNADILILERGIFPSGASTKNAGFACFGSLTELLSDIEIMGEEAAVALVTERWTGLKRLRERLGDKQIDFRNYGGYELLSSKEEEAVNKLAWINDLLKPVFGNPVFSDRSNMIPRLGFSRNQIKKLIFTPFEGQIDSGKMMRSLIGYAYSLGINIYTGAEVNQIVDEGAGVKIALNNSVTHGAIYFKARKAAICTNAFARQLIPDLDLKPGRGVVLVTKPLSQLPFKGVFHMDEGYYYFRNFDNRVLIGGGRNLDFEEETSTKFEINPKILTSLQEKLSNTILPEVPYELDMCWTGIMAFGADKRPVIKFISPGVIAGVRLGGMGIAIGSLVGDKVSQMLLS